MGIIEISHNIREREWPTISPPPPPCAADFKLTDRKLRVTGVLAAGLPPSRKFEPIVKPRRGPAARK